MRHLILIGAMLIACAEAQAAVARAIVRAGADAPNLLRDERWAAYEQGFVKEGDAFACDNATAAARRGVAQTVTLNQRTAQPLIAVAWSKAEAVGGSRDTDYSLYLDLTYVDGGHLWGQSAAFDPGTHDWQRREVRVIPEKPVKSVAFYLLHRRHSGKALFRGAELRQVDLPAGACGFDGNPIAAGEGRDGFMVRDVAADTDYVAFENGEALGLKLQVHPSDAGAHHVTLADATGRDRAIQLAYTRKLDPGKWSWLVDPRRSTPAEAPAEYRALVHGRLSHYPFAAVADSSRGRAITIDLATPAVARVGYSAGTRELYIVYDLAFAKERSTAELRFRTFDFDGAWGFRGALAKLYELYPDAFRCRTPRQGLWMPFHKISEVKGWEDFGFAFKEGDNEVAWDDAHGIITFRYTEPMTWWMKLPKGTPRTMDAANAEVQRLAAAGDRNARALLSSGYHDEHGQFPARLLDTPWCDGAVWSMNSSPGVPGEATDFGNKWNPALRDRLYGPAKKADLDGEYVDSSEGYVTDEYNYRREHFASAAAPLTFAPENHRPAIFRGLIADAYVRGLEKDIHGMNKLMMANGAPDRLWWLVPMLDVLGTETNWNPGGSWRPMSDGDLLYRRALCGPKPYCFLMNTDFDRFPHDRVEKYMKRSLAYGMFPGFFSHNASEGHYFSRPELYDRDRDLFRKYVPLCRKVAEAGWQPVTIARSDDGMVYVERWGRKYLTVFNDSPQPKTARIALGDLKLAGDRDLVSNRPLARTESGLSFELGAEDVAVIAVE